MSLQILSAHAFFFCLATVRSSWCPCSVFEMGPYTSEQQYGQLTRYIKILGMTVD